MLHEAASFKRVTSTAAEFMSYSHTVAGHYSFCCTLQRSTGPEVDQ